MLFFKACGFGNDSLGSTRLFMAPKIFLDDTLQQFFDISVRFIPGDGISISVWDQDWGAGILKYEFPALYTYAIRTDI